MPVQLSLTASPTLALLLIGLSLLIPFSHAWKNTNNRGLFCLRGGSSSSANDDTTAISNTNTTLIQNKHLLSPELNLTVHDQVLTSDECDFLIQLAQPLLKASKVGRNPPKVEPSLRISLSCKLPRLPYPKLWTVEEKLARAAGIPLEYGEDLQVGAYQSGMYYGLHCDERPGGRPNGGGRLATALAYLNTLDPTLVKGGETLFTGKTFTPSPDFPISDVRVSELERLMNLPDECVMVAPFEGRVITFRNMATPNKSLKPAFVATSTHGACPVVSTSANGNSGGSKSSKGATKYVVQQWFGMGKHEVMMGRHPHLVCHLGLGVADAYGIDSLVDLSSRDGMPKANFFGEVSEEIPFLIPNLKATHLSGVNARVIWNDKDRDHPLDLERGLAIGFWINWKSGCSVLRVGPYEWQVDHNRLFLKLLDGRMIDCQVDIPVNQWCHLAFITLPHDGSNKNNVVLETYKSLPGRAPSAPTVVTIENVADVLLASNSEKEDLLRIGGGENTMVDMMMCDLFVINDDLKGRGHAFAHAVVSYDPQQGL